MVLLAGVAERALSVERVNERVWLSGAVGVWGLVAVAAVCGARLVWPWANLVFGLGR